MQFPGPPRKAPTLIPGSGSHLCSCPRQRAPRQQSVSLCRAIMYQLKKKLHSVRVGNYVYLGQNEDDSLGDSILDISENLLQGQVGKVSLYMILVKVGSTCNQAPIFLAESFCSLVSISASHEEQLSLWRAVVLFYIWADNKNWAHKIGPWKYLNYLKFSSEQSASFLLSLLSTLNSFLRV